MKDKFKLFIIFIFSAISFTLVGLYGKSQIGPDTITMEFFILGVWVCFGGTGLGILLNKDDEEESSHKRDNANV